MRKVMSVHANPRAVSALWVSPRNVLYAVTGYGEHAEEIEPHLRLYYPEMFKADGWLGSSAIMLKAFEIGWVRCRRYEPDIKSFSCVRKHNPNRVYRWDIHGTKLKTTRRGKLRNIINQMIETGIVWRNEKVYILNEHESYWGDSDNYDGECVSIKSLL